MAVSAAVASRIPAGWYGDLDDPERRRWWDGVEWTDYYAPVVPKHLTLVGPIGPAEMIGPSASPDSAAIAIVTEAASDADDSSPRGARWGTRIPYFVLGALVVIDFTLLGILERIG